MRSRARGRTIVTMSRPVDARRSPMGSERNPKALVVYYTFSQQTGRVAEVMAEALADKGYDVTTSRDRVHRPALGKALLQGSDELPGAPDPRRCWSRSGCARTGEIRIPDEAQDGRLRPRRDRLAHLVADDEHADPLLPQVAGRQERPRRQALRGLLGLASLLEGQHEGRQEARRGQRRQWLGETHFLAAGGQVKSMLSWLGYMKHGEPRSGCSA